MTFACFSAWALFGLKELPFMLSVIRRATSSSAVRTLEVGRIPASTKVEAGT